MARDRLFFARAGTLHPTHRTPVFGLLAQAVWAMALCLTGTYGQLLDYVIFAALIFYLLTTVALFRLRKLQPDLPRPVKAFGYPVRAGALHRWRSRSCWWSCWSIPSKRKYSAFGLADRRAGDPGLPPLAARGSATTPAASDPVRLDFRVVRGVGFMDVASQYAAQPSLPASPPSVQRLT